MRRALDAGRSRERPAGAVPQPLADPGPAGADATSSTTSPAGTAGCGSGTATSYLRCDDEALLTEVLAHKRAGALRLRRLAPTVLTQRRRRSTRCSRCCASLGYAPAAEAADGALLLRPPRRPAYGGPPAPAAGTASRRPRRRAGHGWRSPPLRAGDVAAARRAARAGLHRARPACRRHPRVPAGGGARTRRQVWIGYVDAAGPRRRSGWSSRGRSRAAIVAAYDHLRQEDRTFAIHRDHRRGRRGRGRASRKVRPAGKVPSPVTRWKCIAMT